MEFNGIQWNLIVNEASLDLIIGFNGNLIGFYGPLWDLLRIQWVLMESNGN